MTPRPRAGAARMPNLQSCPAMANARTRLRKPKRSSRPPASQTGRRDRPPLTAFDTDKIHDIVVSNLKDIGVTVKTENVGTDFAANFLPREVARQYNLATTLFLSGGYPDAQLLLYHHSTPRLKARATTATTRWRARCQARTPVTIYDAATRLPLVHEIQRDIINNPGPIWFGSRGTLTTGTRRSRTRLRSRSPRVLRGKPWLKAKVHRGGGTPARLLPPNHSSQEETAMYQFALRRVLLSIPTLLIVSFLVFA